MKVCRKMSVGVVATMLALLGVFLTGAFAINVTINGPGTTVQPPYLLDNTGNNKGLTVDGATGDITVDVTAAGTTGGEINGTVSPLPGVSGGWVVLQEDGVVTGSAKYAAINISTGAYSFKNLPDGGYLVYPVREGFQFTPPFPSVTVSSASTMTKNFVGVPTLPQSTVCPGPGACTGWQYGNWTPATCTPGSIQTKVATGIPAGCIGQPDAATIQTCPPATCTSFNYTCNGTCTPTSVGAITGTCPSQVVSGSGSPAGCIGGTPSTAPLACTVGVACTGYTYSAWGTCTNNSQSRTVVGNTPAGCSGTPSASAVLTQACIPTDTNGAVILAYNVYHEKTLLPGATQFYKFTQSSACTTTLKQLRVLMIEMSLAGGDGQLLVKSSNNARAPWVTQADYTYEFGLHGYNSPGQDWTRDAANGGVFFYGFLNGNGGETVGINSVYSGHTFNQADTYYALVTNRGTTSNTYRTSFRCY